MSSSRGCGSAWRGGGMGGRATRLGRGGGGWGGECGRRVGERVAEWVYGGDADTFAAVVGALLRSRGLTLAVAESATGGQLASLITEAPGASDYFLAGYVAYSAEAKRALGVNAQVLAAHGTVAAETTQALAA